ncbi:MAG: proton-conducting transporter membrane subunit [Candidatus Moraniibacteriota bacterium]
MTINFIAYGLFAYFLGLFFSAGFALLGGQWKKSAQLFVLSNAVGFIAGILFLFNFASKQIVLANLDWFFHFSPTLNLLSAIFFVLISGVSALVGVYSLRYLQLYEKIYNPAMVQFLIVTFVFGMQGVLFANNSFAFLFFWEVMSIASFFLVFADKQQQSLKAAFFYFVMTHLGAAAILGGFLILSGGNLLFDFSNLQVAFQNLSPALATTAFALFFFGFGSKAGLAPFHVWLPQAHPEAPSNVSALMSGLMLKVAVYGFVKIAFAFVGLPSWLALVVVGLGLLSALGGALRAAIERDLKKAFAYSSIENMGLIFTMIGMALYILTQNGGTDFTGIANLILAFAFLHLLNHGLFKTALFLSSGVAISRFHTRSLEAMGGLAKLMPFFSFAFLLAILGSLPLPPFGTFFGEWGFIQNLITLLHSSKLETQAIITVVVVLSIFGLVSGLAVFAMVKIFGISMLGLSRSKQLEKRPEKEDLLLTLPIFILSASVLLLGIFAKKVVTFLNEHANLLTGSLPAENYVAVGQLSSWLVFVFPVIVLALLYAVYVYLSKEGLERKYQTWDCGQAIDQTMQYSATAFSAPIRFFFLPLIRRDKKIVSVPVAQTNPWIRKYTFSLVFKSLWRENFYQPIINSLNFFAQKARVIQGGRIQYYLLFVLGTLIFALFMFL